MARGKFPTSITVTIRNWDKYNIRNRDYKAPWWFSLNNRILEDSDIYALSDSEFRAWTYILSQASLKKSATITLEIEHADRVCKIQPKALFSLIEKFKAKSIMSESGQMSAEIRPESDRDSDESCRDLGSTITKTEQDKNNTEQDTSEVRNLTSLVIEPFCQNSDFVRFVQEFGINSETQSAWSKLYESEYVFREVVKAFAWITANPRKRPKVGSGAHRFMSGWLERGHESWRRSVPSNPNQDPRYDTNLLRKELGL